MSQFPIVSRVRSILVRRCKAVFLLCGFALVSGQSITIAPLPPSAVLPPITPGMPQRWEGGLRVSPFSTVNLMNRNLLSEFPLVSWTGLGPDVAFSAYHNSANGQWRTSYSATLALVNPSVAMLTTDDGREIQFNRTAAGWQPAAGFHLTLVLSGGDWVLTTKARWVLRFGAADSRLKSITDSAGNAVTVTQTPTGRFISDAVGRKLSIANQANGILVTDSNLGSGQTRTWWIGTACGDISIVDPMGFDIDVSVDCASGLITSVADKNGNVYSHQYASRRIVRVVDPVPYDAGVQLFSYHARGTSFGTVYTDRRGTKHTYGYNAAMNLAEISDSTKTFLFTFDAGRNMTSYKNGVLKRWKYTYDARGNLLTATNPLNHVQQWFYDDSLYPDNLTRYQDAESNTFQYAYQFAGDPTALTKITLPPAVDGEAAGAVVLDYYGTSPTYARGQLRSVTDANGVRTKFDYDTEGQLSQEREGDNASAYVFTTYDFDPGSRLILSERDGHTGNPLAPPPPPEAGASGATYDLNNRLRGVRITWRTATTRAGIGRSRRTMGTTHVRCIITTRTPERVMCIVRIV